MNPPRLSLGEKDLSFEAIPPNHRRLPRTLIASPRIRLPSSAHQDGPPAQPEQGPSESPPATPAAATPAPPPVETPPAPDPSELHLLHLLLLWTEVLGEMDLDDEAANQAAALQFIARHWQINIEVGDQEDQEGHVTPKAVHELDEQKAEDWQKTIFLFYDFGENTEYDKRLEELWATPADQAAHQDGPPAAGIYIIIY